jgi:hypothetical protein
MTISDGTLGPGIDIFLAKPISLGYEVRFVKKIAKYLQREGGESIERNPSQGF